MIHRSSRQMGLTANCFTESGVGCEKELQLIYEKDIHSCRTRIGYSRAREYRQAYSVGILSKNE